MAIGYGGFAQGLVAGTQLGRNLVDMYHQGVEHENEQKRKKQDEDIAAAMRAGYETGSNEVTKPSQLDPQQSATLNANLDAQGGPGDTPGATTPGLTPQRVASEGRSEEERYLDAYRFAQRKAMEIGRPDIAVRAFDATLPLRHRAREQAFTKADGAFRQTGDYNAYVPFFNRFVEDGRTVDKIEKTQIGNETAYRIVGKDANGKEFPNQWMSKDQLDTIIQYTLDPAAVRAAEAKRREELLKHAAEMAKKPLKDRVAEIDPAKSYFVEGPNGQLVPIAKGSRIEKRKNEDGDEEIVVIPNDGGQPQRVIAGSDGDNPSGLTKTERKEIWDRAESALGEDVKIAVANIPDKKASDVLAAARSLLGNLIVANRGNANGVGNDPGVLSKVAAGVAAGTLKVEQVPLNDGKGTTAAGVRVPLNPQDPNGRVAVVYLDAEKAQKAGKDARQAAGAVANSPDRAQNYPENAGRGRGGEPPVSQAQADFRAQAGDTERRLASPQTTDDRIRVREEELRKERAKGDKADQAVVRGLEREIELLRGQASGSRQPGMQPVPAAPAAAAPPAPPAPITQSSAAPDAAGLTPIKQASAPSAPQDIQREFISARDELRQAEQAFDAVDNRTGRMTASFKQLREAREQARARFKVARKAYFDMTDKAGLQPLPPTR